MNIIIFLAIILTFFDSFGQKDMSGEKIFISDSLYGEPGEFYMEGKHIQLDKVFLDQNNIKEIKTYFGKSSEIQNGEREAYLIVRKKKETIYELEDLIKDIKAGNDTLMEYEIINIVIDNLYIENHKEYKIEATAITNIVIILNDKNGVNRDGVIPVIHISTNRKK